MGSVPPARSRGCPSAEPLWPCLGRPGGTSVTVLPLPLLQLNFDLDRGVFPVVIQAVVDEGDGKWGGGSGGGVLILSQKAPERGR